MQLPEIAWQEPIGKLEGDTHLWTLLTMKQGSLVNPMKN